MKTFTHLLIGLLLTTISVAQTAQLPAAFQTGSHEKEYESLVVDHGDMLLTACDNDMDRAYLVWTKMLQDIETKADQSDIDIKGLKLWINAFWDENGQVEHLVFYPKPTCRNVDFKVVEDFLSAVVPTLNVAVEHEHAFSHYGSASFPVFQHSQIATDN